MATIIKIVKDQSVFNNEEKLYISKSKILKQLLDMLKLQHLYDPVLNSTMVDSFREEAKTQPANNAVTARELTINRFAEEYSAPSVDSTLTSVDTPVNENSNWGVNLERAIYLSTPKFVEYLSDLSSDLLMRDDKIEKLREELKKLNEKLPANIYIPFVTHRIRSDVVLRIPPQEAKVFVTKDKVPYLISAEVFDPLEIAFDPFTGTLLGRLPITKLPTPKVPKKVRKDSGRRLSVSPEEAEIEETYKKLELTLLCHFNPKLQDKAHKVDTGITINQVKLAHRICGTSPFHSSRRLPPQTR